MIDPIHPTLELVAELCKSREGALQGLPAGCMPGSVCAVAHLYPFTFWMIIGSGVLIGIFLMLALPSSLRK